MPKQGIHPNYREVVFLDQSNGFPVRHPSALPTKETIGWKTAVNCPCSLETFPNRTLSTPAPKVGGQRWAAA